MEKRKKQKTMAVSILAALFAILQVTGYQISMYYHTTVHRSAFFQKIGMLSAAQCVPAFLLVFMVLFVMLLLLFTLLEKLELQYETKSDSRKNSVLLWMLTAVLLFLCWLPCYAAGYPGFYNYDAFSQVPQVLYAEVPYSAHHPLLHTLLMGKIIAFGYHHGTDLNSGIALHSICQMIVCASAFSYVVCYIKKMAGSRCLYILAVVYYAFFPLVPMFAMCTTKDVLFSVLLLFTVLFLYDMCQDISSFFHCRWKIFRFFGTALLMCLFRKNGVYAFLLIIPFFVLLRKKYAKQILILCGAVVISYVLADSFLIWALDAQKASTEEMLSVPMQQVARVYNDYGEEAFSAEELSLIYAGISEENLKNYNPFLADNIKNNFDYTVIQENRSFFIKLWMKKGARYFGTYITAFLDNTYQAWYPGTSIVKDASAGETSYFRMNMCAGGYRDSRMPRLLQFYERIASGFYYQRIPVLRLLFAPGAMLWVVLFTFVYCLYRKKRTAVIPLLLIIACCLTVLAGPVSLVRYYLILFYGFPVCIGFCLETSDFA